MRSPSASASALPSTGPRTPARRHAPAAAVAVAIVAIGAALLAITEVTGSKVVDVLLLQLALGSGVLVSQAGLRGHRRAVFMVGVLAAVVALGCGALWASGYDVALAQIATLPAECRRLISL